MDAREVRYFVGVKDSKELKTRYRELVLKHHPDKGGDTNIFIAVKNEYDYISKSGHITYPIATRQEVSSMDDLADLFNQFKNQSYSTFWTPKTSQYSAAEEFARAKKSREKYYFSEIRIDDPLFDVIDGILEMNKSNQWILREVNEIPDLNLVHFKYLHWCLKLPYPPTTYYSQYLKVTR